MYYEVIPTRLFHRNSGILTYSADFELQPGHIVSIPIGKTTSIGIVVRKIKKVDFPTKKITSLLLDTPLPTHLLKSIFWLSEYYLIPLPTLAKFILPDGLDKKNHQKNDFLASNSNILKPKPLNPAQKIALEAIYSAPSATKLLYGITGSGKTNIYLKMALNAFKSQKSSIILVPEIALTSQLVQIFETTFPDQVVIIHSKQTPAIRRKIWHALLTATTPKIVIGPRSALLAPLHNLGFIAIDEAHESTYTQENTPKYSSIRLASFIANYLHIDCLLGTATPLITDYYLAKTKNALITLDQKALATTPPSISVIDFKNRQNFTKNRYFSDQLLQTISGNLKNHHQTLIFHNRRGSAPLTICEKCGFEALCPNCFLPLTLHANTYTLRCHTCDHEQPVPSCCPDCGNASIIHKGFGTKLLENELLRLFPNAKIARFDADNHKTETLDYLYDDVKNGNIDIIIGTQTIAKGLDLPNLASVGVVQADAGLSLPDYSAEERTFELLTQVIGRVGRGHLKNTSVIIQTFQPDSAAIQLAVSSNYIDFADYSLKKRRKQHFPPFYYIARISITYKTERTTISKIQNLYRQLHSSYPSLLISAPTPAFHERTARGFTWQLVIRACSRSELLDILRPLSNDPNYHLTLDPPSLL